MSQYRSVGTQTEYTPENPTRPCIPQAPLRKPTTARSVTFQGDTLHRRTQSFAPLATLFGKALGENKEDSTSRDLRAGGRSGARRRLDFQTTSTPTGSEPRRSWKAPTVSNTSWPGGGGRDSNLDISDEDILTIADGEESFTDIGTPSEREFLAGLNLSEENSAAGSSTLIRDPTLFGGPDHMTQ